MPKLQSPSKHIWNPEVYDVLSLIQDISASRIFPYLKLEPTFNILDVGCGNGKITQELAKSVKDGSVIGIDKSQEMISYAKANYQPPNCNLNFRLLPAEEISECSKYDLIFSSFCLQWVADKNNFFKRAHFALKPQGRLAIVKPLNMSPELEKATRKVISSPKWHGFFQNFSLSCYFSTENHIVHLLNENNFQIEYKSFYLQDIYFSSKREFEEYVSLWYPYFSSEFNESQKSSFFKEVMKTYYSYMPPRKKGKIQMNVPVLSVIASKL